MHRIQVAQRILCWPERRLVTIIIIAFIVNLIYHVKSHFARRSLHKSPRRFSASIGGARIL